MREKILELVRTNANLPPLPKILFGLQKLMDDPDCEVQDVYRLLKTDPVLSGRLITLANSALFGSGRDETRNLEDAVVRLGMNQVIDLVYALVLPKTFKKSKAFDQIEFWKHSLAVAFIARSLAKKALTDFDDIESSFLAGLMHDVGIMVLDNVIPRDYFNFLTLKDLSSSDKPLELLEEEEFKIAHPEAGAEFMIKWWSLSPKVASAALAHHGQGPIKGEPLTLDQVVSTANRIANMNAMAHPVTTAFEDPPEEGCLDVLEISQEDLDIVIDTTKIGLMAAETLLRS
ncbi:MAG: HDOD domain-containing protein [Nitrospinaceae bacterium]|nr:HDOD domain-containing protein [Nitrospinaceae bacterium]